MKKSLLLFVMFTLVFMFGCEKTLDLNLKDGRDGTNGKDGRDASIIPSFLPASAIYPNGALVLESFIGSVSTGKLIIKWPSDGHGLVTLTRDHLDEHGNVDGSEMLVYSDQNDDGIVSSGDKFQNGLVAFNGKDSSQRTILLPKSTEHPNGAILFENYTGTVLKSSLVVDLPGNGHGLSSTTKDLKDENGNVIGSELLVYSDQDDSGTVTTGDIWQSTLTVYNGSTQICTVDFQFVDCGCSSNSIGLKFTSRVNGEVYDSLVVCIPIPSGHKPHVCDHHWKEGGCDHHQFFSDNDGDGLCDETKGDIKLGRECLVF